jgi:hypothetical protein
MNHWGQYTQFLAGVRDFSLLLSMQTTSGAQPASYMSARYSFPEGKQLQYAAASLLPYIFSWNGQCKSYFLLSKSPQSTRRILNGQPFKILLVTVSNLLVQCEWSKFYKKHPSWCSTYCTISLNIHNHNQLTCKYLQVSWLWLWIFIDIDRRKFTLLYHLQNSYQLPSTQLFFMLYRCATICCNHYVAHKRESIFTGMEFLMKLI